MCDVIRDDTLPELGVRLEDHEGNKAEVLLKRKESKVFL